MSQRYKKNRDCQTFCQNIGTCPVIIPIIGKMAHTGGCLSGIGGSWEDESVILPCLKAPEHRHFKPAIGGWEDENANRRKNENGR